VQSALEQVVVVEEVSEQQAEGEVVFEEQAEGEVVFEQQAEGEVVSDLQVETETLEQVQGRAQVVSPASQYQEHDSYDEARGAAVGASSSCVSAHLGPVGHTI